MEDYISDEDFAILIRILNTLSINSDNTFSKLTFAIPSSDGACSKFDFFIVPYVLECLFARFNSGIEEECKSHTIYEYVELFMEKDILDFTKTFLLYFQNDPTIMTNYDYLRIDCDMYQRIEVFNGYSRFGIDCDWRTCLLTNEQCYMVMKKVFDDVLSLYISKPSFSQLDTTKWNNKIIEIRYHLDVFNDLDKKSTQI